MATERSNTRFSLRALALTSCVLLAACGGGSGSSAIAESEPVGGIGSGMDAGTGATGGGAYPAPDASGASIILRWDPSNAEVAGYNVYSGPSPDTVTNLVRDVATDRGELDPAAPAVRIRTEEDLGLTASSGEQICLAVEAYNAAGPSPKSEPVCATL